MIYKPDNSSPPPDMVSLDGIIDHYIFQNELNGYSVAVFLEDGKKKKNSITVVGYLMGIAQGESIRLWGTWVQNPKFGRQFEVKSFVPILPATVVGIGKYLGSGLIKGIGKEFARRIVEHFGAQTLEIIDHDPDRLREVRDIGPKRLGLIKSAWQEHQLIRDIMIFLQSHNISLNLSTKIFQQYGADSIRVLRENPYQLAIDIYGIGFEKADKIAQSLGIPKDAPERAKAGVLHTLNEASGNGGHTFLYEEELLEAAAELLQVEGEQIRQAIKDLETSGRIVIEKPDEIRRAIFPRALYVCETGIAERLKELSGLPRKPFRTNVEAALTDFEKKHGFTLADLQKEAIRGAMAGGLMVITGGPGTGKTTIVRAIIEILPQKGVHIKMAAPTGRAAKRLEEATGREAFTIHRLLKFKPHDGKFTYNELNPLPADLLIVDETSMVDVVLAYHLIKALPRRASVIFVGDADQLPSVGPGNFLQDLITSGRLHVIRLKEIFRQARRSLIVVNAHRINHGEFPFFARETPESIPDFHFIEKKEPEEALKALCKLVEERIPARFGFDPMKDIQVITPMYKGLMGANNLNHTLQNLLNPNPDYVTKGSMTLRVGDKVMQLRNNYDKDVYNGDLGLVVGFDREYQLVRVKFDGRIIPYQYNELDDLTLAYAITVHKSQGSEYPAVVLPILTQHYIMLQRNLLYTAVTRGRRLVCLVGTKQALAIAIRNVTRAERHSALGRWLSAAIKSSPAPLSNDLAY